MVIEFEKTKRDLFCLSRKTDEKKHKPCGATLLLHKLRAKSADVIQEAGLIRTMCSIHYKSFVSGEIMKGGRS